MLNVVMLGVSNKPFMLSVFMLSVVMLTAVAPILTPFEGSVQRFNIVCQSNLNRHIPVPTHCPIVDSEKDFIQIQFSKLRKCP